MEVMQIYGWRKWEKQAYPMSTEDLQGITLSFLGSGITFWLIYIVLLMYICHLWKFSLRDPTVRCYFEIFLVIVVVQSSRVLFNVSCVVLGDCIVWK